MFYTKRALKLTQLFNSSISKRYNDISPAPLASKRSSVGGLQPSVDNNLCEKTNNSVETRGYKTNDDSNNGRNKSDILSLREQVISAKFSKRIQEIKRIEEENIKLAHRLFQNKPCISK